MTAPAGPSRPALIYFGLIALAILGYLLPWLVAPASGMTLNGYDLAEWASLHPAERRASPPLLTPLLLRAQLVFLSLLLAVYGARSNVRTSAAFLIAALALAQLPPLEFARDMNNLNYRQQFALASLSLVAGLALLRFGGGRMSAIAAMAATALPLAGILTSIVGLAQAQIRYQQLQLGAEPGAGAAILCLSYAGVLLIALAEVALSHRKRS